MYRPVSVMGFGVDPSALIGRDREIAGLKALLSESGGQGKSRLVSITGGVGIGKTAILETLGEVALQTKIYPVFFDCADGLEAFVDLTGDLACVKADIQYRHDLNKRADRTGRSGALLNKLFSEPKGPDPNEVREANHAKQSKSGINVKLNANIGVDGTVLGALGPKIGSSLGVEASRKSDQQGVVSGLEDFFSKLNGFARSHGYDRIVVLFDDFDGLGAEGLGYVSNALARATVTRKLDIDVIVTGQKGLEASLDIPSLRRVEREAYSLSPLTPEQSSQLLTNLSQGTSWDPEALRLAIGAANGSPALLHKISTQALNLVEDPTRNIIELPHVGDAALEALDEREETVKQLVNKRLPNAEVSLLRTGTKKMGNATVIHPDVLIEHSTLSAGEADRAIGSLVDKGILEYVRNQKNGSLGIKFTDSEIGAYARSKYDPDAPEWHALVGKDGSFTLHDESRGSVPARALPGQDQHPTRSEQSSPGRRVTFTGCSGVEIAGVVEERVQAAKESRRKAALTRPGQIPSRANPRTPSNSPGR